ncbi:winged helix-turn-helix transcriptional regulator [Streptomyces ferrugineus]|uniref:Winged helix-turn-helix transcriptional regulator n=1 Tax=Streptomyces ferrugineus TaxID=1413221 RepID=A0A7M2SRG3_9ACTN|nr:winged helix-turn-helix domain-containing protein [Streptomyces ferrugineus]QOV38569.1 winged helix-turn-helix transcriptional regulator [Streptomyces ferrugineus]
MPVRIHFSDDDLAGIRLAQAPDPMWEALLSMHMLQTDTGSAVFGGWRTRVRRQLPIEVGPLFRLAPPAGYSADFLTPAAGTGGLDAGIGALLSTPRRRLRGDLVELSRAGRRLPPWARPLADGDKEAVGHVAGTLRRYFATALAPWWSRVRTRFDAERAAHARYLANGGPGSLLSALHPGLVWRRPVLEVTGLGADRDVHLDGRGLLVLPSYFCWRKPTLLKDPALPCVVVYPMTHETVLSGGPPGPRSLNALLGRTRAGILESLAQHGVTTTELAQDAGISPATASHHVGILRKAGLVSTCKAGRVVLHTATPLGMALLDGDSLALGT